MYNFPKVDLHLHLDGSVLPETAWELARERHIELPADNIDEFRNFIVITAECNSVNEYLARFELPLKIMQDKAAIIRITRELVELLASQGLCYAEIRFAPQLHTKGRLSQKDAIEAVLEGVRIGRSKCSGIMIGILVCAMSVGEPRVNANENLETVRLCREYLGRGVVGLDLAGAEGIYSLEQFGYIFEEARRLEVPFTCHAGDTWGAESVRTAIAFGARRIGHGHRAIEDDFVCKELIDKNIALEICPTSNIQCKTQISYKNHPLKKLFDIGIKTTINTDNMILSNVNLNKEYDVCIKEMGLTETDIIKMNMYSVEASFMPAEYKNELIDKLKSYL